MKIIRAGYEIWTDISEGGIRELQEIERAARVCYKSEDRITEDGESAKRLVKGLIKLGHEAMLEHGGMTVKFIVDRGMSHEIVRHRLFSFAQESTRYCDYTKDKHGGEITVVWPCYFDEDDEEPVIVGITRVTPEGHPLTVTVGEGLALSDVKVLTHRSFAWCKVCLAAEDGYFEMLDLGCTPQEARAVLPNSLKTELVVTGNWREWRHFFALRTAPSAHPQMREVADLLLEKMHALIPVLFDDIWNERLANE